MATADEVCGSACGYLEEYVTTGDANYTKHRPPKGGDPANTNVTGVVQTRKYCVRPSGHAGGHVFRTV